jgi:hypothetical protein
MVILSEFLPEKHEIVKELQLQKVLLLLDIEMIDVTIL